MTVTTHGSAGAVDGKTADKPEPLKVNTFPLSVDKIS
jgi:hypothetical protein